jgi:hypothetical protein
MENDKDIRDKINNEMERLLEENTNIISKDKILEILSIFKNLDMDLIPILEIIEYAINNIENEKVSSIILKKVVKFYGLGKEVDILKTRQKISLLSNKLIKKPFLKKENIEMINILLQENNII